MRLTQDIIDLVVKHLRDELFEKKHDGADCPICTRKVKMYKRKLNKDMAKFLVMLVSKFREERRFYATNEIIQGGNKNATDGIYLVHWGLIEKSDDTNRGTQGLGLFRPTQDGISFALNETVVPTHAHIFLGEKVGESFDRCYIADVLGKNDYSVLRGHWLS